MLGAGTLIWLLYVGGYFSAWFISVVAALVGLMVLSIPRRIVVDKNAVSIVCVLEIVELPIAEIASVRLIEPTESRWIVPLFASRGFFGYYGYYLDLSSLDRVHFYATEWQNLVEIVDIYDDRYYVSCREHEQLIAQIEGYISHVD